MKLVTYDGGGGPAAGLVVGDSVYNAAEMLRVNGGLRDIQALLELPENPLERLREVSIAGHGPPLSQVRLLAPVLQPPTVRDFMVYEGHATGGGTRQQHEAWYRMPIFYFSNPLRIFGPDATVPYPSAAEVLDYELEVGVVIGKEGSNVREADWLDYVAGSLSSMIGAAVTCSETSRL
jgi:2-keto-4-pentenoate hydratase/2-oxohepta-3-ene-1,7-dioic acid hydratase in catechol pathway